MKIYPSLAVGYFILFLMYSAIIFLYYFNDLKGAVLTAVVFCSITFVGSYHFNPSLTHLVWHGCGGRLICRLDNGLCETAMD